MVEALLMQMCSGSRGSAFACISGLTYSVADASEKVKKWAYVVWTNCCPAMFASVCFGLILVLSLKLCAAQNLARFEVWFEKPGLPLLGLAFPSSELQPDDRLALDEERHI